MVRQVGTSSNPVFRQALTTRGLYYKTHYDSNLRIFVVS
jgi:hypothetical protein